MTRSFELQLPVSRELPPDAAASQRAALVALVAAGAAERRRRRPVRRLALAAAVVLAALVAIAATTPAFGLRDDLVRFLHGNPPSDVPKEVASRFTGGVHGRIELRTSIGARVTLWTGASDRGECLGLSWSDRRHGGATCGGAYPDPLYMIEAGTRVEGAWVRLIFGTVASTVDSLELMAPDGRTAAVPLSDGYFLAEIPPWPRPTYFVARDGALEVIRRELKEEPAPPDPLTPRRYLIRRASGGREWAVYTYPAAGDRHCYGLEERTSGADEFHLVSRKTLASAKLLVPGPSQWPAKGTSPAMRSLFGLAPRADHVEIRLADGSDVTVHVEHGAFLYVARADTPRPRMLTAYAADATQLATQAVPG